MDSAELHGKTLRVDARAALEQNVSTIKALASVPRWRMLQCLAAGSQTINALADLLRLPSSTVTAHIRILEDAGLVHTELQPAAHGLQKVCSRTYDNVLVVLPAGEEPSPNVVDVSMPIGAYSAFDVVATCGLAGPASLIGYLDDPFSFYEPERINAGLIWFRSGYLEYLFPNRIPKGAQLVSVQVSMEICSEAPLHHANWPSDITLWLNDHEIGTWTCPSDFGGQRGALTPGWWDEKDSQYGLLKRWMINNDGAYIDGRPLSRVALAELELDQYRVIKLRIGVKHDALHVGGLNLFGQTFGNYPQDLVMRLEYVPGQRTASS